MNIPCQHVWYWPEYGPRYSTMEILQTLVSPSAKTVTIQDISCQLHEKNTFSIDIKHYTNWRVKWFHFVPSILQMVKSKQFFASQKDTSPIRVILYHVDHITQKEWSMFLMSPFRVDIITRSLTLLDPTYLAKVHMHRIPSSQEESTWKETPWKMSAERIKQAIKKEFSYWRSTRDLLYEWMLFQVDYEEAIFDVFHVLHEKPLPIQAQCMRSLLSLLSLLSTNKNREVIKPSIRATTNQHTFYILEQCLLTIAKEYHTSCGDK